MGYCKIVLYVAEAEAVTYVPATVPSGQVELQVAVVTPLVEAHPQNCAGLGEALIE